MDNNKKTKLDEIGYKVAPSCGTCKNFRQRVDEDFGECVKYDYVHLKHSGGKRSLSVVRYGVCDGYEEGPVGFLHGFVSFLTRTVK